MLLKLRNFLLRSAFSTDHDSHAVGRVVVAFGDIIEPFLACSVPKLDDDVLAKLLVGDGKVVEGEGGGEVGIEGVRF